MAEWGLQNCLLYFLTKKGVTREPRLTCRGQRGEAPGTKDSSPQSGGAWPWPDLPMPQQGDMQVIGDFYNASRRGTEGDGSDGCSWTCVGQSQAGGSSVLTLIQQGVWQMNLTSLAPADTGGFLLYAAQRQALEVQSHPPPPGPLPTQEQNVMLPLALKFKTS